jgi:hypothetical protein
MAPIAYCVYAKYTPDTSYTSGGDAMDFAAKLPYQVRGKPFLVEFIGNSATLGYTATYDYTNKKVQLWNGTTEASGNRSANVFDVRISVS